MTIVLVVILAMAVFMGCKYVRGQILDGPGMERDTTDYPQEEPVDGVNACFYGKQGECGGRFA